MKKTLVLLLISACLLSHRSSFAWIWKCTCGGATMTYETKYAQKDVVEFKNICHAIDPKPDMMTCSTNNGTIIFQEKVP